MRENLIDCLDDFAMILPCIGSLHAPGEEAKAQATESGDANALETKMVSEPQAVVSDSSMAPGP
jgi:hypothetical protein